MSSASTASSACQEPSCLAASTFANPAGAISPAAVSRSIRCLFSFDQPVHGARREPEHGALVVKRALRAVNPAEAERLLHRLLVRHARLAGALLEADQPDTLRADVVLFKPGAPFGTGCEVDCVVGFVRHGGLQHLQRPWTACASALHLSSPLHALAQIRFVDLQRGAWLPDQAAEQAHDPRHARLEYPASRPAHQR